MIPTRKKTPEELAALREGLGFFQAPDTAAPPATPDHAAEETAPAPTPEAQLKKRTIHSLRKVELPLFPAPKVQNKTPLPSRRRSAADLAEIQRREALTNFSAEPKDPVAHLKKLEAHPVLLIFAYLPAFTAIYTAWNTFHYITPISLIFVSGLLTAYIFWTKKRSRHHAAILLIILAMTLVFGGIHYAPLFKALFTAYAT